MPVCRPRDADKHWDLCSVAKCSIKSETRPKNLTAGLWVLLSLMVAANVLLIRQNFQMRGALEKYEPQRLKVGAQVPAFTAVGLNSEVININYAGNGPKRVLLFFTATCPFCRQQFPYWRELLAQVDGARFEVLGLVDQNEDRVKL